MFPSPWSARASIAISRAAHSVAAGREKGVVSAFRRGCFCVVREERLIFSSSLFSFLSQPLDQPKKKKKTPLLSLPQTSTTTITTATSMTAASVLAEWASALASRGSVTDEEIQELLGAASLVARGEEAAVSSSSSSPSSSVSQPPSSAAAAAAARDVLDALRPLCTFTASAVPGKSASAGNVSRVASAAAALLASLKSSTAGGGAAAARGSSTSSSSPSSPSSSTTTMTKGDWQSRFTALNAALCASLEAPALSKGDKETISGAYAELVRAWLPRFGGSSSSSSSSPPAPAPAPSDGAAPPLFLEEQSMLTGFKRALRDKASPLPILPAHAAELLSTAVEALEHAKRGGRASAGVSSSCNGKTSANAAAAAATLSAPCPSFTDDTALALGRHAGDDTALALADQLLAISSRRRRGDGDGDDGGDDGKTSSSSSASDNALRSRLFEYACRGLREALRDILDDIGNGGGGGGGEPGRTASSNGGGGGGSGGSSSSTPLGSAGGSFASSSADGGGSRFHRASSSSWLLSALADGVSGLGGGGAGGALAGGIGNGGGIGSSNAAFFGAASAAAAAGTAIDLASIRLPSASFAKATATLAADLAIGLDVGPSSSSSSEAKSRNTNVVVVGAKDAKAPSSSPSRRPRQRGGPHLALACDLLLESIEACVGLAWQAAGPAAAAGRGAGGGGAARQGGATEEEGGSGSGSAGAASLVAAALACRALDIGTALASAAPELLDATATAGVAAALDAPERVHALMRSAARLADVFSSGAAEGAAGSSSSVGGGGASSAKRIWRWDLEAAKKNKRRIDGDAAAAADEQNKTRKQHVSSFASAEALTDALSSSLTALLAAAWRAGDVEGVKAALVPLADLGSGSGDKVRGGGGGDAASTASYSPARPSPGSFSSRVINDDEDGAASAYAAAAAYAAADNNDDDSPYEQQAELLTAGRLAAALAGDAELLAGRAAARLALEDFLGAADDARRAVAASPGLAKAHMRRGYGCVFGDERE